MLGETHRRIAKEIAKELRLGEREASLLETGSTAPDNWADFPHHHGKEKEILDNILEARNLFLENDDECYHKLGIALHYLQDRWTLRPRLSDKHTEYEREIDTCPLLDTDLLKEAIKNHIYQQKLKRHISIFLKQSKRESMLRL